MNVLLQYELHFNTKKVDNQLYKLASTGNQSYQVVADYLFEIDDLELLEEILDDINAHLENYQLPITDVSAGPVIVDIQGNDTTFSMWKNNLPSDPILVIPTEDFKDILKEWEKFLEKPID